MPPPAVLFESGPGRSGQTPDAIAQSVSAETPAGRSGSGDLAPAIRLVLTGRADEPPGETVEASAKIMGCRTKRRNPAENLVSVLVAVGHDTTASLIGNGVVALLDHPDQQQAPTADLG